MQFYSLHIDLQTKLQIESSRSTIEQCFEQGLPIHTIHNPNKSESGLAFPWDWCLRKGTDAY